MKQQIEPKDILKGDLVRYEYGNTPGKAMEWIAEWDTHSAHPHGVGNHFLLDRKVPVPKNGEVWRSTGEPSLTYTWDAWRDLWRGCTDGHTTKVHPSEFGYVKVAEGVNS